MNKISHNDSITAQNLLQRSKAFAQEHSYSTQGNLIEQLMKRQVEGQASYLEEFVEDARATRPICSERVLPLLGDFLAYKRAHGSASERALYAKMTPDALVDRLLQQRPLAFLDKCDHYLLRDGTQGRGGFELIGSEQEAAPLVLRDYLSYDEIQLSALIALSSPTRFINNGWRSNRGQLGRAGSFEPRAVYVGMVGARLEREGLMEWQHVVVTPEQNQSEHGYGADCQDPGLLGIWAKFYDIPHMPSYAEAQADDSGRFIDIGKGRYLDSLVYKRRIRSVVEPFLRDANLRAEDQGKQAFVHAVGIGLGVWLLHPVQEKLVTDVYADCLRELELPHISDIRFSWFRRHEACGGVKDGELLQGRGEKPVRIHFNLRQPAWKLAGEDSDKLLVASYAWDGNSYPGNEYWLGSEYIAASGDPAAASCSSIVQLHNPAVNPNVGAVALKSFGAQ